MTTNTFSWAVQIWIPALPPVELSKNGRAHWSDRNTIFQQHKQLGRAAINRLLPSGYSPWRGPVDVSIVWRQHNTGHWPDRDNTIERCACLMDAAEDAGLIVDDKQIRSFQVDYVKDRNEGVQVTFSHDEGAK